MTRVRSTTRAIRFPVPSERTEQAFVRMAGATTAVRTAKGLSPMLPTRRMWPTRAGKSIAMQFARHVLRNQVPVKSSVLDEDFIRTRARDDHARNINTRHIALQRFRIAHRTTLIFRQLNPNPAQERVVRMVSNQRKDEIVLQHHLAFRCV